MITNSLFFFLFAITLFSCKNEKTLDTASIEIKTDEVFTQTSKAQVILDETIEAHGGKLYNSAHYSFVFRGNTYYFKNEGANYEYKKHILKKGILTEDIYNNGQLSRFKNSKPVELSQKEINTATGIINSVIYFATLPHKLNDEAVNKTYIGETTIKEKNYYILGITFNKEGGGEDHDDDFYYWINKSTKKIDYLAYNYKVNKGGVRFRSAYNTRIIDGITFQDYINYKAEVGTALKDLPELYEAKKLKELSKIETENIINLNKN